MLKREGAESQTVVVHNWGRELREKTAPRRKGTNKVPPQ